MHRLNPLCSSGFRVETTAHNFLRSHLRNKNQTMLLNDLKIINQSLSTLSDTNLVVFLLYGNENLIDKKNQTIIMCSNFLNNSQDLLGDSYNFTPFLVSL